MRRRRGRRRRPGPGLGWAGLLLAAGAGALGRTVEEERLIGWKGEVHRVADVPAGGGEEAVADADADAPLMRPDGWIEAVSWRPRAFVYHNFLTDEECEHIIKMAEPSIKISTVVNPKTNAPMVDTIRTSYGTFLNRRMDAMLARIEKKVALFTKIPEENMEDMQVLKYENGQKYGDHWDVFDERTLNEKDGYQRIATVLMYLSDVELGGETAFPSSTAWVNPAQAWADPPYTKCADKVVSVRPHKGDALLFFSLDPEDKLDTKSLHAGCPVLRGTKWSATKWIHVKPFRKSLLRDAAAAAACTDDHENCASWAEHGECKNNPGYMVGFGGSCRLSCGDCTPAKTKVAAANKPHDDRCPPGDVLCLRRLGIRP